MEIIPVIHIVSENQVLTNLETCAKNGISKIFLIDHSGNRCDKMVPIVRLNAPKMWCGLNFLQGNALEDFQSLNESYYNVEALWIDNAGLLKEPDDVLAKEVDVYRKSKFPTVQYFGGVEFKYQKQPNKFDIEWVYKEAVKYIDVITTSGPGTGRAAELSKLERIRVLIGSHPLAVASGVSYINKSAISKFVDFALVASSITQPGTELIIEDKLKQLLDS